VKGNISAHTLKAIREVGAFNKQDKLMPTISMFYGIIIRMYYAPSEHPPPHFHVYYAEYKAIVDIRRCEISEGNLPKKQSKLVLA